MPLHFDDLAIINGDAKQLNALFNAITTAPFTLRVSTAEKLFTRLFGREQIASREQLDAAFVPLLSELKTAFVAQASQDDNFYCSTEHPLRQTFECLLTRASTWYTRDSKTNQMFYEKLADVIRLVTQWCALDPHASSATTAITALQKSLHEFLSWDDIEEKRATLLESRICESELNHLKMLTAECSVLDLINHALANKTLPPAIVGSIQISLKNELQHCAFTAGIGSPFWKLWQRLLPIIGNIFTRNGTASDDQQMYREIPAILNEIERSLEMGISHPESYNYFIQTLSDLLMQAVQKQPIECQLLPALPYPEGHSDINTRVTDSILQQSANIQTGDWILFFSANNQIIRCKLALKNADIGQLLFVDRSGRKVMIKSEKDFSLCVSTGIVKLLTTVNLSEVITKLLQALIALQKNSIKDPQTQLPSEPEKNPSLANVMEDEKQRLHIATQVDLRRAAAHKAMAEARALADEKTRRTAEAKLAENIELNRLKADQAAAQEETQAQQLQFLQQFSQQQINALNVGAWVEISNELGEKQRCKLAVIIASVGKYIFVDNLGRKIAEYQREQLLQLSLNQHLTLINNGDKFEDQLVKVIRSLRKDVS